MMQAVLHSNLDVLSRFALFEDLMKLQGNQTWTKLAQNPLIQTVKTLPQGQGQSLLALPYE